MNSPFDSYPKTLIQILQPKTGNLLHPLKNVVARKYTEFTGASAIGASRVLFSGLKRAEPTVVFGGSKFRIKFYSFGEAFRRLRVVSL